MSSAEPSLEALGVLTPVLSTPPPEARRALVDDRGQAIPTEARRAAWEKVEQMRWWQPSVAFPPTPNEYLHFRALQDWIFGFVVTSVMLLAPGVGAIFLLRWQKEVGSIQGVLALAIAMIALILLVLVMQRLAQPMWGSAGAPALWLRRLFLLSLPTPVFAALATLVRPSQGIEWVGMTAIFAELGILIALLVWFLVLYFSYTSVPGGMRFLDNTTPGEALRAFYDKLRPGGAVKEAVQYQTLFRTARFIPPEEEDRPAHWEQPATGRRQTLSEMSSELGRLSRTLDVADFEQDFDVAGAVVFQADGIPYPGALIGCCAIDAKGIAGEGDGSARVQRRVHRVHILVPFEDGWFVENPPLAIPEEEAKSLYESASGSQN